MITTLVLPALAALGLGLPAAAGHHRLHPRLRARSLAVVIAALVIALGAALGTVAVGFLSALPWATDHLPWCRGFARTHDDVPAWLGLPALAALATMAVGAARSYYRLRRTSRHRHRGDEVVVVDDDRPDAYAVGGTPGHIVVSSGMLRLLDGPERAVLLAHERAHLRHRHHHYIALALVGHAAVPFLGFLTRRLRLALECWADEDAAAEVGDRRLVARTIIRAALARADYGAVSEPRLGALGVPARVDALLSGAPTPAPRVLAGLVAIPAVTAAAVAAGSAIQVHHLLGFASHVCRF